jgi:hypothetical protein
MQITTKFNLNEKAWTFGFDEENRQIIEVQIQGINIEFNVLHDGSIEQNELYKVGSLSGRIEVFLPKNEIYKNHEDFLEEMRKSFESRKHTFPTTINLPNE